MGNFKEDIARVRVIVLDVDGVMTDGGIIPTLDGDFIRRYNAKDGYALAYAIKIGYKVCIITGGRGRTLENRLRMLGIDHFYVDCMDKISALHEYFAEEGIDPRNAIYMGDDIPDLECMREVGIPVCPADAAAEVIEASRYVSEFKGGEGAVRDIVEQVLRARDSLVAGRLAVSCRRERRDGQPRQTGQDPKKAGSTPANKTAGRMTGCFHIRRNHIRRRVFTASTRRSPRRGTAG